MLVEIATNKVIPEWLELAREVEPLFEGQMAEDTGFHEFVERKIVQREAFVIRNHGNSKNLMGLIGISHNNNAISWFAVFEKYQRKGVGSKLLEYALKELDNTREISVTTFREDNREGIPARRLYQKFGFVDCDVNAFFDGHPRSIMKRFPKV